MNKWLPNLSRNTEYDHRINSLSHRSRAGRSVSAVLPRGGGISGALAGLHQLRNSTRRGRTRPFLGRDQMEIGGAASRRFSQERGLLDIFRCRKTIFCSYRRNEALPDGKL